MIAKKKKIQVGWVMMRLNKAGNWVACRFTLQPYRYLAVQGYASEEHRISRRAGTLKVVKIYVTM